MIDLPCAILCGGLGTRLGELTKLTPKSLVMVAGKPFIFWQLDLLEAAGFTEVRLCIGHYGTEILNAVRIAQEQGKFRAIKIGFSMDKGAYYGTANAIRRAFPLRDAVFCTLYGDSYLECDYGKVIDAFNQQDCDTLMTTYAGVDYGFGVFRRQAFIDTFEQKEIKDVYERLRQMRRLCEFEMPLPWKEMGSPQGLKELEAYLNATHINS